MPSKPKSVKEQAAEITNSDEQKSLRQKTQQSYQEKNVVKSECIKKEVQRDDATITKFIERVTYRNGVIKTRVKGKMKNGKIIWGDAKYIKDNK